MQSVGLDIHLKHINACIRDDAGKVDLEWKFKTTPEDMDKFLINVDKQNAKIVIEASKRVAEFFEKPVPIIAVAYGFFDRARLE